MAELPSISEMRRICRPHKHKKLFIEFYNPIFSIYFTRLFVRLGVSANGVTLLMLFVALGGGVLFAFDKPVLHVLGGLLYLFAYFLDWVDGEVARLERWQSQGTVEEETADPDEIRKSEVCDMRATRGMFLDQTYHFVATAGFLMGVGLSVYQATGRLGYLILGCVGPLFFLLKGVVNGLGYLVTYNHVLYSGPGAADATPREEAGVPKFVPWYGSYMTAKNYIPLALALVALGVPVAELVFVCVAGVGYFLLFWWSLGKLYRRGIERRIAQLSGRRSS